MLSAKSVKEKSEAEHKSLIYKINNKGPSEEPCGTPNNSAFCACKLDI